MAIDNRNTPEQLMAPGSNAPTVLDEQHAGDIVGALGTLKRSETGKTRSWRRKFRLLLIIIGPGLIVMGGGNDAGGVQVYAQMGQDYGMRLLWSLALLFPILFFCQEMVVRLGAVSGVGHGRLIFARFGKFWGIFSVADLFVINAVTIVVEFIGVEQSLSFFGMSSFWAVLLSAILLFAVMAGGTYRYWERFLIFLVIANFVTFPMAYLVHTRVSATAAGAIPRLPGGLNATILLLIVAVVGTTIEPWQLFFQQSNVVDKRITPRWMNYERLDTGVGVAVEVVGAVVLMAACAFGLAHTKAFGNFADLTATCADLQRHVGHGVGYLLALAALDGSLIGANLTALTTSYTLGDVYPKMRHSLHWKPKQAPRFYGLYALLVGLAAVVTLAWGNDLGVVIDGVEALNGILLPSALVFLILLANDKPVLGPWTNNRAQNWIGGLVVWAVTTFSLAPLVTTFYPDVTLRQCLYTLVICTIIGLVAAAILWRFRPSRPVSPGPDSNQRPPGMTRSEWREVLRDRRTAWRTPRIDTLQRPALSVARKIGLLTLRGYIIFAIIVMAIKLVQVTTAR
ncbi:MAG TPA: NRAMP family divalent metal transporter [Streptosporangiaceae bacterium]|nr:NRAMP family divalent metal transporter [Streptosporangiaceae bacterium]